MHTMQQLVDCCFAIALSISENKDLRDKDNEEKAKWVAERLKNCGFDTRPSGASWGVLLGDKQ